MKISGCAARIASRDHHSNFAAFPATLNDVMEISALVACGAGTANFNLYVGTAVRPDTSTGAPLMAGGGKSPSATWQRTTWRFKVTQAMVDNLVVNPSFERGLAGYTGQSSATSVVELSVPHCGTRALKVDPGNVTPGQLIPFVQGRTYEIGVWVKEPGATTDNGAGNNKLRIGNSAGQPVFERPYNSGTVGTNWTLISGRWKATETGSLPVTLNNYLKSGSRYFDDFYVTDVTDRVDIDATAGAVTGLTSRVSKAEGTITSQSQQLTNLQNSLNTTNSNVSKKADATALTSVDNRVTEAEGKLTTQSQQLTNLANVLMTAQESMNVDNMSFVVPAGTGDAVLRYGCYLDRNGQMVLTILSRFDAFAARNNNVIRAASSA